MTVTFSQKLIMLSYSNIFNDIYFFPVDPEVYVPREDDTRYNEVDFDSEDTKYNKGQAHHMFSRFPNLKFYEFFP